MIKFLHNGINGFFEPCAPENLDGMNNNFFALDILVQGKFLDFVDTLPNNPSISDAYIFTDDDGDYAENSIVAWNGVQWVELEPSNGWVFFNDDNSLFYYFNNGTWSILSIGGGSGELSEFYSPSGSGAVFQELFSRQVATFSQGAEQEINASVLRVLSETSLQKKIKFAWFAQATDNINWSITAYHIKTGEAINSVSNFYSEQLETEATGGLQYTTLNVSDVNGQINGRSIESNDMLFIIIKRANSIGVEIPDGEAHILRTIKHLEFN